MNRTAYSETYRENDRPANRQPQSRASIAVTRHLRIRRMQAHVVLGILGSTALLIIFGMLLLILPAFRVRTINVKGNEHIAEESVIAASGVSIGDEILTLKKAEIADRLQQNENIERVSVSRSLGGVTIKIVEKGSNTLSNSGR